MNLPKLYQILAFSLFLTACDQSVNQDTLTVYTSRQPQLIEPILDKYSEATGIDIVLLSQEMLSNFLRELKWKV